MQELPITKLDPRLAKQADAARKALISNPSYAVEICSSILQKHPECLDLRKIMRQAQMKQSNEKKGSFIGKLTQTPFSIVNSATIKKDPKKSVENAEKLIIADPRRPDPHIILGKAFKELGLLKSAIFGFETARKLKPNDVNNIKELAEVYIELGEVDNAIKMGEEVSKQAPGDPDGQDIIRRASVSSSLKQGKWEEDSNFRDKLKDQSESEGLETENRTVLDNSMLMELIQKTDKLIEEEPQNLTHYKNIVSYYEKLKDLKSSLQWLQYTRSLDIGKNDVTLEKLENKLSSEIKEQEVAEKKEALDQNPDDSELQASYQEACNSLAQYKMQQSKALVEKYPNDYGYRFEYGKLLMETGDFDNSIEQFQLAQRNPKVRIEAIIFLGKAYRQKNFIDLAIEQFQTVKKELTVMDSIKKETIYYLAQSFEDQENLDSAIAEYKLIYSADIGYKDVAEKINDFYSGALAQKIKQRKATKVEPISSPKSPAVEKPTPSKVENPTPAQTAEVKPGFDQNQTRVAEKIEAYREIVKIVWLDCKLARSEKEYLDLKSSEYNLPAECTDQIEIEIMGFPRNSKAFEYKKIVEIVWLDQILAAAEKDYLDAKAKDLDIADEVAEEIEIEIMGFTRDNPPPEHYQE